MRFRVFLFLVVVCLLDVSALDSSAVSADEILSLPQSRHYAFRRVGDEIGLSTLEVMSIVQDRDGFLWIGTADGVFRYDGIKATDYGLDEGLPATWVSDLGLGPDGSLWAGTDIGVAHFNGIRFVPLALPRYSVDSLGIRQKFALDRHERIYLASNSGLVAARVDDPSAYRVWSVKDGLPQSRIDAVYCDSAGTIWFASGHRLGRLSPRSGFPEMLSVRLPDEPIVSILRDRDGKLWVRTENHLGYLKGSTFVLDDAGVPSANGYGRPSLDRSGDLLVPTVAGLFREANGRWISVGRKQGMTSNVVLSATQDREGAYWIGHEGHGIERWPGADAWSGWTTSEGLPDDSVEAIARDSQDRLWVGTINGLAMWEPSTSRWRTWNDRDGLAAVSVVRIAIARDGSIVVLCYPGGITIFGGADLIPTKINTPTPLPEDLVIRPDGDIWIGSGSYLKSLVIEKGISSFRDVPVPPDVVGTTAGLRSAPDGVLWTSGARGLSRFDGKKWTHYTTADGLLSNRVWDLAPISADKVCVIYDQWLGITCLRLEHGKPRAQQFDAKNGLAPAYGGYYIEADRQGRIWTGGTHGVTRVGPDGSIRHFSSSDGLLWDDLNEGAFLSESDGSMLFGTTGGLARYAPPNGTDPVLPPPKVVLTSVLIGNREHVQDADPEFSHTENTFNVRFSALTFRDPASVSCKYRLNGLESDFTVTTQRATRYTSLPSGSYRFEVLCRSAAGVWSAPAAYTFSIRPAWWERWWFRALVALLAVALVWWMIRFRTRHLEAERARLEEAVAQRSSDLAAANSELAAANSELKEASLTDPLTRLHNRRFFQVTIGADVLKSTRLYSENLADQERTEKRGLFLNRDIVFYIVDIDHFKMVNDVYGHPAGDALLVEAAKRIDSAMRKSDSLVRWGGEEFLVVSYPTERSEAERLALRIMANFSERPFDVTGSIAIRKTCSIGWAPFPWFVAKPDALDYDEILKLADRALYEAKEAGRNRAVGLLPVSPDVHYLPLIAGAANGSTPPSDRVPVVRVDTAGPALETEPVET